MCERAYIEGQNRPQSSNCDSRHLPPFVRLHLPDQAPALNHQNRHQTAIENQAQQAPPYRDLNRRRMKMPGRESALVIEPKAPLELCFAAFPDADQRMVFNDAESLTPHLEPVSGAPFLGIEHRDAARVLDGQKRQGKNNQNAPNRNPKHAAPAACESHPKDRDAKSHQRGSR